MKLSPRFLMCFVLFVVLGVYYPALFGGFNSVDDLKMVTALDNQPGLDLYALFRPASTFYYRPLLILSYYADGYLMGFAPEFMHLVNIALHAVNTLLVFALGRLVFATAGLASPLLPLLGALLFGLHPLNTESVCWISGRSDLLGTLFVLLSLLVLLHGLGRNRPWLGLPAAAIFLAGVMSKEVMLFFLPAALFLIVRWPAPRSTVPAHARRQLLVCYAAPFALGAVAYGIKRILAFGGGDAGVNFLLRTFDYGALDTLRVALKAFGFYVKKLFLPLPLNFAIVRVSDLYVWLGVAALVTLLILYRRRSLFGDLLLVACYLVLPALLIALTNVAWTPLAERYLYLPTVFWSLALVGAGARVAELLPRPLVVQAAALTILLGAGLATAQRTVLWQNPVAFYRDAIVKTPDFPPLQNELALALLKEGRGDEAQAAMRMAQSLDPDRRIYQVHLGRAVMLAKQHEIDVAREIIDQVLADHPQPSLKLLQDVAHTDEVLLLHKPTATQKAATLGQLAELYEKIHGVTRDPFIRYRQAQVFMFLGKRQEAAERFEQAWRAAPATAHYKQAAGILADKMRSTP